MWTLTISSATWSIPTTVHSPGRPDRPVSSNKPNILVVGDAQEAAALFGRPGTTGVRFSRCARGNDMATSLRQPGRRYDWVLVSAASFDGDEKDLIRSLSSTGFFNSQERPVANRSCGVEWLSDGTLQMHCCRQHAPSKSCASSQYDVPVADSFVFEYQAPVKRAK